MSTKGKLVEFVIDPENVIEYVNDAGNIIEAIDNSRTGGCLIAENIYDDTVIIGYSFCNNKLDRYNKEYGKKLAINRMHWLEASKYVPSRIHPKYRPILEHFLKRCKAYFKTCTFPAWSEDFLKECLKNNADDKFEIIKGKVQPKHIDVITNNINEDINEEQLVTY